MLRASVNFGGIEAMVSLTEALALSRARADSMEEVKSLNLWGNGLSEARQTCKIRLLAKSITYSAEIFGDSLKWIINCGVY